MNYELTKLKLPCGGTAYFDEGAGYGYRCRNCMAVVGSVSQPQRCKDEASKWEVLKNLGSKGWDYSTGDSEI